MKILQVNKFYHPTIGGVETVVKQYAEALASAGHEATVLCVSDNRALLTCESSFNGVHVVRCSSLGTFLSMPCSPSFLWHFLRLSGTCDLIHFHEPFPIGSLCSLLIPSKAGRRFKVVVTWHSDIVRQKLFKPAAQFFQHLLLRKADKILPTSENLASHSDVLPQFKDKLTILPLSIDPSLYATPSKTKMESLPECFILSLGRLSAYKGMPPLLDAFAKCKVDAGIKLLIAGSGPMAQAIEERIATPELKGRVVFLNRKLSEEEKLELLHRCLFFVFPSTLRTEAFGIAQLEAMACAKAIINTSLPTGVPWVSPNGVSGLTVPPDDVDALASALESLAGNPERCDEMGANGLKRVNELFSDANVLAQYLSIISSLAKK